MNRRNFKRKLRLFFISLFVVISFFSYLSGKFSKKNTYNNKTNTVFNSKKKIIKTNNKISKLDVDNLPVFNNKPYVVINDNNPDFENEKLEAKSFENYSNLDYLGRCGVADAIIGKDIMPTSKRENISSVKPTGWKKIRYDDIDGKSLYNRCHLIGFQLAGENANKKNLITGTRYLNVKGMLAFENMVCDYVKETNHHVRYRVKPIFIKDELVARGVQMEALSIEDDAIKFNVYCFNSQPNVEINYKDGTAKRIK